MKQIEYVIIGAGISGLGFANFLKNENYLIIEKEKEPGGYCRTIYNQDFIWDYAGHFFHFANPEIKDYFNDHIPQDQLISKIKNTKILFKDILVNFPFQKNIHQLPKEDFIDCIYYLFNKTEKDIYDNFEDMLYGKFGKGITDKFLKPYNEKIYACNLNKMDQDAMGRFFPYANIKEIIDNIKKEDDDSYNHTFSYPKKGAVTFVNALLKNLDKNKISLNEDVISINSKNKILTTNKREIKYNQLINTTPLIFFMKMENPALYKKNLNFFSYNKVLVYNLGFNKKSDFEKMHWCYIPSRNINFYRMGFYDNILDMDKLSMYIEIGYSPDSIINEKSELNIVLDNLKNMHVISDHHLEAYSSITMNPAYVHITSDSNRIKNEYKKYLVQHDIFTIGRYGDWKYCSIEDCIIDAKHLALQLQNKSQGGISVND